ncbi:GNAT family N-acetyltransferase [Chryseobacterium fluminis]|uniref:GNAT family N-acetyltransferase n=1 Tax=Chryseobacterium fluminis TaxID=2983606 RepID=UPI0022574DF3|nr:GNAT family N-acetyltransferase [Chryseobacterium sp. MMS21-Ot14]UZT99934.1 GNAT family N-acetyltransferase [Chryseobacterium sp. MMS21-Ot14]
MLYKLKIYHTASHLPENWNTVVGDYNIMLSKEYFQALEMSSPENMDCFLMGFFQNEELIGGALFQYLDFYAHATFQKNEVGYTIRNFFAKKLSRDVMILGNNMLTGQNGFYFNPQKIDSGQTIRLLSDACDKMQKEIRKTSLIIYKDYQARFITHFKGEKYKPYVRFSVQPNMMLILRETWKNFDDYLSDLSKKYRVRAKSARKKNEETVKTELTLSDIVTYQAQLNRLYQNVAENASFNTFFLSKDHFRTMKENLGQDFKIFGYFSEGELIGFYTLMINGEDIDTYFLGYHKELQKEKQLYLNMLLDMVDFAISNRYQRIIFGRTALEIKSTVGAEPLAIFGLIKHNNSMINLFMKSIFFLISPKVRWIQRRPFKQKGKKAESDAE